MAGGYSKDHIIRASEQKLSAAYSGASKSLRDKMNAQLSGGLGSGLSPEEYRRKYYGDKPAKKSTNEP